MIQPTDTALRRRAAVHQALGDIHRLKILDALALSDRTPSELSRLVGLPSNLLAFHLDALEEVGLVVRRRSQGDRRRRYVSLGPAATDGLDPGRRVEARLVLFVCTRNSSRSQLAAALWKRRTGLPSLSGGTEPADSVHPLAVEVAAAHGLDLSTARPRYYQDHETSDLVVSVCDRARESGLALTAPLLHWSVPDPADGDLADYQAAYDLISRRVDRLAGSLAA